VSTARPARRAMGLNILPTAVTVLAICSGLTSVKYALDGRPDIAVVLLAIAAVLDSLDGGLARILNASSQMGKNIDSLADMIDFGVAPALVLYVTLLSTSPVSGIVVLLYTTCIALRLARFNAMLNDGTEPAYTREFFVGMPGPAAAGMAILPLVAKVQFGAGWWTSQWFLCPWLVACSVLVVSRLPMSKMPALSVRPNRAVLVAALAIAVAAAVLFPYLVIFVVNVAYLCYIPFSIRNYRRLAAHPEACVDRSKQRRVARRAIRAEPNRRSMARLRLRRPGRMK